MIGVILVFVLILTLNMLLPVMINWVNSQNNVGTVITGFDSNQT